MRASRQIKLAEAGQLAAMSDGVALIMENQRFVSPHVLPVMCDLREEIAAELGRRSTESGAAAQQGPHADDRPEAGTGGRRGGVRGWPSSLSSPGDRAR